MLDREMDHIHNDDQTAPATWEIDNKGRRFRRVGKTIEYAPTIKTTLGDFYMDELAEVQRMAAKQEEERRAKAIEELKNRPAPTHCPFNMDVNNQCKREACGLFFMGKCSIAILADERGAKNIEATEGKKCPFSIYSKCGDDCAIYNNGCGLVRLAANTSNKKSKDK